MQGPSDLGHLPLPSRVHQQGAGWEMEKPGLKLVPLLDANTLGRGLVYYTLVLAPRTSFKSSMLCVCGVCRFIAGWFPILECMVC